MILVAVNRDASDRLICVGSDLARRTSDELVVMHVREAGESPREGTAADSEKAAVGVAAELVELARCVAYALVDVVRLSSAAQD